MRTRLLLTLTACLTVVACDGGGTADPATIAPTSAPPTLPPTSPPPSTTGTPPTTTSTVPATLPGGVEGLSPDGPWHLVDSAPGITTPGLVYELMPKLWVYLPTEEDIDHGILWTFTPADRDIIEAYLHARLVYFRATSTNPINLEDPGWQEWYIDGGEAYFEFLAKKRDEGQVGDLDLGVVLRPQVLGEGRTDSEAIVFDCVLDGGVFRTPDGSLAPGSSPGVGESGIGFRLALADGRWAVAQFGKQPDACA